MSFSTHPYKFDPTYGYTLETLLTVGVPEEPIDYDAFWEKRFNKARFVTPKPELIDSGETIQGARIFTVVYKSTGNVRIGGWLTLPENGLVERGFVISHGYGGRDAPDLHLPFKNAAIIFPCARGISKSPLPGVSADPGWHVIHDLSDQMKYIHGLCVEDIWVAASALIRLFPQVENHLGFLGISFGGGIGAMAMAFDSRFKKAHFNVPSFGNQPLRLELQTEGSGAATQLFYKRYPEKTLQTLSYHDAAIAARRISMPVHCACAVFDPMVAPPGQFAVYNAIPGEKYLYKLSAGHFEYVDQEKEEAELLSELKAFFADL